MRYVTNSPDETELAGCELARSLPSGAVLLLFGDLGSGKTCFTRGFARGMGVTEAVTSPTFTIVNEYEHLLHFDLYRIDSADDLHAIGFLDYLERGNIPKRTVVIEWAERIASEIPYLFRGMKIFKVLFSAGKNADARIIEVESIDDTRD